MGYQNCSVLEDGINRWTSLGYESEWGINVPSKDFGERLQVQQQVPEITAEELESWITRGERFVLVDSRTPEEHNNFCIPGSRSVPGGELALRVWDLMDTDDTPVVVHCAGRTRSIVGTSIVQRMGVKRTFGLRNGTMGWQLAGFDLEEGSNRLNLESPTPDALEKAEAFGRRVATEDGVQYLTCDGLQRLKSEHSSDNVYLIDVRSAEEFEAGHVPGFWWYPGGQAVQESDNAIGAKAGHIVFSCDGVARASVTASLFRQMGYPNVYVLDGGTSAWKATGHSLTSGPDSSTPALLNEARSRVESISPRELRDLMNSSDAVTLFVGTSAEFAQGHPSGTRWAPRGSLELLINELAPSKTTPIALVSPQGRESLLAGLALLDMGYESVVSLEGGTEAWAADGNPLETGLSGVMSPPTDLISTGSGRNFADAINYLRWEIDLGHKYEQV
jgi:rhodanese-related sulfurtransferase